MEKIELEKIRQLIKEGNYELKKLYEEHVSLDKQAKVLSNKSYLTQKEQEEYRNIKIKKLQGKEKMLKMIADM